jgi:hypothetical protein
LHKQKTRKREHDNDIKKKIDNDNCNFKENRNSVDLNLLTIPYIFPIFQEKSLRAMVRVFTSSTVVEKSSPICTKNKLLIKFMYNKKWGGKNHLPNG